MPIDSLRHNALHREVPCKQPPKPVFFLHEFICAVLLVSFLTGLTTWMITDTRSFAQGMKSQKELDDKYRPADKTACVSDNGYVMCSNGFIAAERNSVGYTNSLPTTRYCPSGYIAADGFCRY